MDYSGRRQRQGLAVCSRYVFWMHKKPESVWLEIGKVTVSKVACLLDLFA